MLTRAPHQGTDKSPKAMTVGEKGIWGGSKVTGPQIFGLTKAEGIWKWQK